MSCSSVEPLAGNLEKKIPRRSPRLAAQNIPRRSVRLAAKKEIQIPPSSGYHSKKKRLKKKHSSSGDHSKKKCEQKKHPSSPAHPEMSAPDSPMLSPAEYRQLEKDEEKRRQAFFAKLCSHPGSIKNLMINCYPRRPKYFDGPC